LKTADAPGQNVGSGYRTATDADAPLNPVVKRVDSGFGFFVQVQQPEGVGVQQLTGLGGRNLFRHAVDEPAPEVILQLFEVAADGGLGEVDNLAGLGEALAAPQWL
jgi:hypothetical protein